MIKFVFMTLAAVLTGCAPQSTHLEPTSLGGAVDASEKAVLKIAHAQGIVTDTITSRDVHPAIAIKLRQVQADLTDAQQSLAVQKTMLNGDQDEINILAVNGNKAIGDRDYYHHKSDTAAGLVWKWRLFFFVSLAVNVIGLTLTIVIRFFRVYLSSVPIIGPILADLL